LPGSSAQDFLESWLKHGSGGTCWSGNGALQALLSASGFNARRGVGTMLVAPDLPPNHGTVIVNFEGRDFLLDASIMHVEPMPLDSEKDTREDFPAWGVKVGKQGGQAHVWWTPLHMPEGLVCRIDKLKTEPGEFHERHESTREWSPFNFELHFRIINGSSVTGIVGYYDIEKTSTREFFKRKISPEERTKLLIERFGLSEELATQIPPDTPTPPPPGSKKAASLKESAK